MSERILRSPMISPVGSVADALPTAVRAAIDEAYERGLADGYEGARGDLAQHSAVLAGKLAQADGQLIEVVRSATTRDASTLLDLAIEIAEWFVGQALVADPELTRASVSGLLASLDEPRAHTLFVHPDIAEILADVSVSGLAGIETDASLAPGELRLTTDGATVERVWHQAIDRVRAALLAEIERDADDAS